MEKLVTFLVSMMVRPLQGTTGRSASGMDWTNSALTCSIGEGTGGGHAATVVLAQSLLKSRCTPCLPGPGWCSSPVVHSQALKSNESKLASLAEHFSTAPPTGTSRGCVLSKGPCRRRPLPPHRPSNHLAQVPAFARPSWWRLSKQELIWCWRWLALPPA